MKKKWMGGLLALALATSFLIPKAEDADNS